MKSNVKIFAADSSLFTVIKDENESAIVLINNLLLISRLSYNWKMLFNSDPSKPP